MYNQTDSYNLKITDGEKKMIEPQYGNDSLFDLFKNSYNKLLGKE